MSRRRADAALVAAALVLLGWGLAGQHHASGCATPTPVVGQPAPDWSFRCEVAP